MDQHFITRLDVRHCMEGIVGGQEIGGNAGCLLKGQGRGQGYHQIAEHRHILAKGAGYQRCDPITHLEGSDPGADLHNFTGTFTAQQRPIKGQNAQHIQHIQEI